MHTRRYMQISYNITEIGNGTIVNRPFKASWASGEEN